MNKLLTWKQSIHNKMQIRFRFTLNRTVKDHCVRWLVTKSSQSITLCNHRSGYKKSESVGRLRANRKVPTRARESRTPTRSLALLKKQTTGLNTDQASSILLNCARPLWLYSLCTRKTPSAFKLRSISSHCWNYDVLWSAASLDPSITSIFGFYGV